MKLIRTIPYLAIAMIISLSACTKQEKDVDNQQDANIKLVENGLLHPVVIKSEKPFNIQERMNHYGVPGVSIAVIKDFKIEWAKSYGIMDSTSKEPVTNETLFQAGSISKPVAAYAALKAVQDGKIELESPINDYLTSWKIPDNEFTEEKAVTLGQILSHSAGLTVHGFPGYTVNDSVPSLVNILDGESPANTPAIRVFRTPGAKYKYSGGGYTIMQQMMIDQYQMTYPEILDKMVLSPLKMDNSTYSQPLPPEQLPMAATGYLQSGNMTAGKRHTYPEMAAAGLWTTASDLARFAIDIQLSVKGERNQVLSQEMASQFTSPYLEEFVGLGIFLQDKSGDVYFDHGGWDEGFSSFMVAHKEKGYGLVVLTNSNHPSFINEVVRGVAKVYDWPNYPPEEYESMAITEDEYKQVVGRYKYDNGEVAKIFREGNGLFLKYLFKDPMRLFKISEEDFIRQERIAKIRFAVNPEDGDIYLTFPSDEETELKYEHPKLGENEILPIELLISGNYEAAESAYLDLQKKDPEDRAVNENELNNLGYEMLYEKKYDLAISIFKVNIALYPESSNTYDSLGEAYMENGDFELAIKYYQKSFDMDPSNTNARNMIEKMKSA